MVRKPVLFCFNCSARAFPSRVGALLIAAPASVRKTNDIGRASWPPSRCRNFSSCSLSYETFLKAVLIPSISNRTSTGVPALCTASKDKISRGCLLSKSVKSCCCNPGNGVPLLSVTTTSSAMRPDSADWICNTQQSEEQNTIKRGKLPTILSLARYDRGGETGDRYFMAENRYSVVEVKVWPPRSTAEGNFAIIHGRELTT